MSDTSLGGRSWAVIGVALGCHLSSLGNGWAWVRPARCRGERSEPGPGWRRCRIEAKLVRVALTRTLGSAVWSSCISRAHAARSTTWSDRRMALSGLLAMTDWLARLGLRALLPRLDPSSVIRCEPVSTRKLTTHRHRLPGGGAPRRVAIRAGRRKRRGALSLAWQRPAACERGRGRPAPAAARGSR